jgi:hypothetical protein
MNWFACAVVLATILFGSGCSWIYRVALTNHADEDLWVKVGSGREQTVVAGAKDVEVGSVYVRDSAEIQIRGKSWPSPLNYRIENKAFRDGPYGEHRIKLRAESGMRWSSAPIRLLHLNPRRKP